MPRFLETVLFQSLFAGLLLGGASEVTAALGRAPTKLVAASGAVSSVAPGPRMLAATPAVPTGPYQVAVTQLENGTSVHEYATPAGLVFAVSWRGPVLPDLAALLGDYFHTFKLETEQVRLTGRRGSPVNLERDGLVVRSNGRMRNFFGHAYAPELIPPGVNIRDVLP